MHPHADEIALIRSCSADSVIHAPAMYQMNTGRVLMGFPSLGSWVTYGLGSESENLPAYVVMSQPEGTPEGGAPCWGAGFLPAHYQGTLFRSGPVPIVNLKPPAGVSLSQQRGTLDFLRAMNEQDLDPTDTELSARIASYELAFRMQVRRARGGRHRERVGGDPRNSTASMIRGPWSSGRDACSRVAWSSAASDSSSSTRAAGRSRCSGTPTTISTPTTRRCAG